MTFYFSLVHDFSAFNFTLFRFSIKEIRCIVLPSKAAKTNFEGADQTVRKRAKSLQFCVFFRNAKCRVHQ